MIKLNFSSAVGLFCLFSAGLSLGCDNYLLVVVNLIASAINMYFAYLPNLNKEGM